MDRCKSYLFPHATIQLTDDSPACTLLIHFKSRDLQRLWKQGRFWHIFFLGQQGGVKAVIISQDEIETFTVHMFVPLDADVDQIDSKAAIYQVLGGLYDPFEIEVDEILVRSVWRPNLAVTRTWHSPNFRIFLAGDSAHQFIPTGGYGMNSGIGDAFDLGWKIASVVNGEGGPGLLQSYETERRPVALRNVEHSGTHFKVHQDLAAVIGDEDARRMDATTEEGRELRQRIHDHYQLHDGENKDFGIEMGQRYTSPVIMRMEDEVEPSFNVHHFVPTTWPGGRAPSLFLSDGTAIYDGFGKHWTLLNFADPTNCGVEYMTEAAKQVKVTLDVLNLFGEEHAAKIYERPLVLIRPDQHVVWRGRVIEDMEKATTILKTVTGRLESPPSMNVEQRKDVVQPFTSTNETTIQVGDFSLEGMGDFQR